MRALNKPDIAFEEHYENCIANKVEPTFSALQGLLPQISNKYAEYIELASSSSLHQLSPLSLPEGIKIELSKLYKNNMSGIGSAGRNIYAKILAGSGLTCPLCKHGYPNELDHYLPKNTSNFPELSLAILNLVPACGYCNRVKSSHSPANFNEQYFHPYFDSPDSHQWLEARTIYNQDAEILIEFYVSEHVSDSRYSFQFSTLNLNKIYSAQAATELSSKERRLRELHGAQGIEGVKSFLEEDSSSATSADRNSWRAALYRCLSSDSHFHNMEWKL